MPFQVVFNTVQLGVPPVVLISAGVDTFVACGSTVNLQGTVDILANLPGHAILWEQVAGVNVVLSNTDTLATSYALTESSDKIFRLWIDKGLPTQQFKEVSIFHTPLSIQKLQLNDSVFTRPIPTADFVECNTISATLDAVVPDTILGQPDRSPCQPDGSAPSAGINFDFTISWTVPTAQPALIPFFIDSELYYADTNTPVPNAIYTDLPGSVVSHSFFPGGENELKRYYIVTSYIVSGNTITNQSCEVDYTTIPLPVLHVIDDNPVVLGLTPSITTITKFFNIVTILKSNSTPVFSNLISGIMRYDNIFRDTGSVTTGALSNKQINISRFDPTGIGT